MIDLLETQRVKQALEDNPAAAQQTLESTPLAICITNRQGKFVHVNDNYCRLYGYSREELIGQSFTMVVPEDKRQLMMDLHDKFLQDKREIARTWTVQGKDGQPLQISVDAGYTEQFGGPHKITLIMQL